MKQLLILVILGLSLAGVSTAQQKEAPANPLRPPKGAKVAVVVFEDLQCPDCARAAPLLEDASHTYKIPLVRHDFPLTKHNWSKPAAIMARYFDTKSKQLGNEFRDYCFKHQIGGETPTITSPEELRSQAEKFATDHKVTLPLAIDPQGKFLAEVDRDLALGASIGIQHTPTIYVVSNQSQGKPFVEVVDRNNLFSQIDDMIAATGGNKPAPASAKKHRKTKAAATTGN